jgi:glucokinase
MRISRYKQILSLISNSGPKSRNQFADSFDITLSGAKRLVDNLILKTILRKSGHSEPGRGRPTEFFEFNPDFVRCGIIYIGRATSKSALYDFAGKQLEVNVQQTDFSKDSKAFIGLLQQNVQDWLSQGRRASLKATAIVAGGVVNHANRTVSHLHPENGWQHIVLDEYLSAPFKGTVIAPYAYAAMTAEAALAGLKDVQDPSVFFHFGSNVVSAFSIRGHIHNGLGAIHGHLGHTPVPGNTLACYCGKEGCAETLISTEGIINQFKRAIKAGAENSIGEISLDNIIRGAAAADPLAQRILQESARIAGTLLSQSVNFFGPRYIVLGGTLFFQDRGVAERLANIIQDTIREKSFVPSADRAEVRISKLGIGSLITGGAIIARNRWIEENM